MCLPSVAIAQDLADLLRFGLAGNGLRRVEAARRSDGARFGRRISPLSREFPARCFAGRGDHPNAEL